MSLAGKVAIVTGTGRGLGLAYAGTRPTGCLGRHERVDARTAAEAVASIEADGGVAVSSSPR